MQCPETPPSPNVTHPAVIYPPNVPETDTSFAFPLRQVWSDTQSLSVCCLLVTSDGAFAQMYQIFCYACSRPLV